MTTSPVASITDEQLADIERRDLEMIAEFPDMDVSAERVRAAIVARLREAEKDAARYRWLRERAGVVPEDCKTIWVLMDGCSMSDLERQETDQAIDAAIEKKP